MAITRRGVGLLAGAAALAAAAPSRAAEGIFDVAVIGAGVFGAWTAAMLARDGAKVAVIDAYGPGNARASSGGESRVIRVSYGGDGLYSRMAAQSLIAWRALSARCSLPIFHETGVLWFAPAGDAYMAKSLAYLQQAQIPHEAFAPEALGAAYPQISFQPNEAGFLERASGALIAGRGVQETLAAAGLRAHARRIGPPPAPIAGIYDLGEGLRAAKLVYACGPWLPALFPDHLKGRIQPTRQEVYHFAAPDTAYLPGRLPIWADFNGGDIVYGFPDLEGQGFKMAFDRHGPPCDPDRMDRTPTPAGVAQARSYLQRRFPALAAMDLIHARVCQYENSASGDLLIDRLPGHERVWLVGAGSGHGFKHGPAVGRLVADALQGRGAPLDPRFSLASKGVVAQRSVY